MAVLEMQRISICAMKKDRKAILEKLQSFGALEVNHVIGEDPDFVRMDTAGQKLGFEKEYRQGLFEGLKTAKSLQKTPVFPGRFKRELAIQMELIAGTVIYIYELSRRKLC